MTPAPDGSESARVRQTSAQEPRRLVQSPERFHRGRPRRIAPGKVARLDGAKPCNYVFDRPTREALRRVATARGPSWTLSGTLRALIAEADRKLR